jgi:RES domain-containing protein
MDLWRLCRRPNADLSGEGARILGGRWNSPGRPAVYFAEHPALAALEVRVHLDLPFELLPNDFVLMRAMLPDKLVTEIDNASGDTVAVGDTWLVRGSSAALRVPSVLLPHAWNILLNPRHPDAARARIAGIDPFHFDPRLWQPLGGESFSPTIRVPNS